MVAWDDGLGAIPRVLVRASADGGRTFGKVYPVSAPAVAASFPVVGMDRDSVTVAWTQTSDAAYRAEMAARLDMSVPGAKMPLPRVGQQEVLSSRAAVGAIAGLD